MTTYGTYNILHETYPSASPSYQTTQSRAWSYRSAQVAQNIASSGQDAVAIQEVSQHAFLDLQRDLAAYGYVGEYAQHHGGKPDGVAIFYKKAKFTRLARCMSGHMSGVRTTTRRNDLYLDLQDNTTRKVIRFATSHIEGNPLDTTPGNTQLSEIMAALEKVHYGQNYGVDQIVVGADFNQEHGGERAKILSSFGYVSAGSTYETEVGCKRVLDGVWVKSRTPVHLQEARLGSTYQTASDHHLLGVMVTPTPPPSMQYHSSSSYHHHSVAPASSEHDEKYLVQTYQPTPTSTTMQHSHPSASVMSSGSQLRRRHVAPAPQLMVPRLNVPSGTSFRARQIAEASRSWRVPGNHSDAFYNVVLHEALRRADREVEQSKTAGNVLDFRSEIEKQLFLVLFENGVKTQREIDAISDPFMTVFDQVSRGSQISAAAPVRRTTITSAASAPAHAVSTVQTTEILTGKQMAGLIVGLGILFALFLIANS